MANQAPWNLQFLAADPTSNVNDLDVYPNDGTLTATGQPGFRWYDGNTSSWADMAGTDSRVANNDADVTNPPTDAELDSAFGTPASVGDGFIALLDDNGAGANVYLVGSDGTNWWYVAMTKAT